MISCNAALNFQCISFMYGHLHQLFSLDDNPKNSNNTILYLTLFQHRYHIHTVHTTVYNYRRGHFFAFNIAKDPQLEQTAQLYSKRTKLSLTNIPM